MSDHLSQSVKRVRFDTELHADEEASAEVPIPKLVRQNALIVPACSLSLLYESALGGFSKLREFPQTILGPKAIGTDVHRVKTLRDAVDVIEKALFILDATHTLNVSMNHNERAQIAVDAWYMDKTMGKYVEFRINVHQVTSPGSTVPFAVRIVGLSEACAVYGPMLLKDVATVFRTLRPIVKRREPVPEDTLDPSLCTQCQRYILNGTVSKINFRRILGSDTLQLHHDFNGIMRYFCTGPQPSKCGAPAILSVCASGAALVHLVKDLTLHLRERPGKKWAVYASMALRRIFESIHAYDKLDADTHALVDTAIRYMLRELRTTTGIFRLGHLLALEMVFVTCTKWTQIHHKWRHIVHLTTAHLAGFEADPVIQLHLENLMRATREETAE